MLAFCPAHDNTKTPALSVSRGDDRILVNCKGANCTAETITAALGLKLADLFYEQRGKGNGTAPTAPKPRPSLTLEAFAKAKGLELDFLLQHGVTESNGALTFHHFLMNGQKAARQHIRLTMEKGAMPRFIWSKGDGPISAYGIWRIAGWHKADVRELVLVEGESDALSLWLHGIAAVGIPGVENTKILQAAHIQDFSKVYIVRENDPGGETFEKGCIGRLAQIEYGGEVRVVEMAGAAVKDANELHLRCLGDPGGFESEWGALVMVARKVELPLVGLEVFDASLVKERPVEWLWHHRIPLDMLTLFVGIPGVGKSFAALDVVARLSNGSEWPDGSPNDLKVDSIVFSAEDTMDSTIVPRLRLLGADLTRVKVVKRIREANEAGEIVRRSFSLLRDLPQLERLLDKYLNTKMVLIDPVSGYMSRARDTYNNAEMRSEVLDPLAELAERRGVAILAVTHFNKGSGNSGNALDKVSGSIAFPAAARAVWGFVKDPEDPDWQEMRNGRVFMVFGKCNVGPTMSGLAYRVVGLENEDRGSLVWVKGAIDDDLKGILAREREQDGESRGRGRPSRERDDARQLLVEMLGEGPVLSKEVDAAAVAAGISIRTLNTARKDLCVRSSKEDGKWWLSLPPADRRTPPE